VTRISQKKREQDFLEHFKRLYPDFPKGTIIPGKDPPDLLVENKNQRIGFEVTELYPEANNEEISFDKRLELERDILKKASLIFEKSSDLNFNVIAQFKPKFTISKSHKEKVAKGICDAILYAMSQNQSISKFNTNLAKWTWISNKGINFK